MDNQVSFIPLGGVGDVTKNMYLYEYQNKILIVDCGLGFADETMLGVDLLLPDISYLLKPGKKIVGMILTHGHEDHIGALPFVLPQLPQIPIYASPLTAALANEKLKEFRVPNVVKTISFDGGDLTLADFKITFIRVTHSVPDSANLFIRTPVGNFYHGSDNKFDLTPYDSKTVEFDKIAKAGMEGVLCLMSDSLGAQKNGHTPSEMILSESFENEMAKCRGKFILTTYSSNISRLNQAIEVGQKFGRKVCFIGRSLIKAKEVAQNLLLLNVRPGMEINTENLKNYKDHNLLLLVAGSQGQENSAMTRIASDDFREVKLGSLDTVVFSSEQIPGNEVAVNSLIDEISKKGTKVVYSETSDEFHVSGHGYSFDIMLLMSLVKPKKLLPIGGTFRQMVAYRSLAESLGHEQNDVFLIEDGQEVLFGENKAILGKKIEVKNVYVDEITGEEVEGVVLRDRQKLSEGGVVVLIVEVNSNTGQIVNTPQIIFRGFSAYDKEVLTKRILNELKKQLSVKKGRVVNWTYIRKLIGEIAERSIFKELHRRPLVLPVVIEV
ncbi:MAG: ribonuclease J [bacterium]|nr:ribonuclease J [bacterium]